LSKMKFEEMIKYDCFNPLFPRKTILPSIDSIGKALAKLDLEALGRSFKKVIWTLYINKNFSNGTIDGKTVYAMDGTDIVHTNTKRCPNCMYIKNAEGYYYAHKSVVAMVVGREINYVIG
jgi:hypothetical protein